MKTNYIIILLLVVNIIVNIGMFIYIDYHRKQEIFSREMERMTDRIKATMDKCDKAQHEIKMERSLYQY